MEELNFLPVDDIVSLELFPNSFIFSYFTFYLLFYFGQLSLRIDKLISLNVGGRKSCSCATVLGVLPLVIFKLIFFSFQLILLHLIGVLLTMHDLEETFPETCLGGFDTLILREVLLLFLLDVA